MVTKVKANKPTLDEIVCYHILDDSPDLSFIGEFSDTPGKGAIDHRARSGEGNRTFQYFNPANPEYAEQEYKRMMEFERCEVGHIGIKAEATIWLDAGGDAKKMQIISSGGLWGIESDSEPSYFKEIEADQIEELRGYLEQLNVDMSNFDALAKAYKVKTK